MEINRVVLSISPAIEIDDANHISCVAKEQYRKELAAWLEKQSAAK